MKPENQEKVTRFYQEPLMLIVIGIPILAVIWGFIMLSTALKTKDSLVSDSYYKDGVSYTENQAADEKARSHQINATAVFTADEMRLTLNGLLDEFPNTLQVHLIHPTLEDRDVTLLLQQMSDGSYAGVNDIELPGRRRIWVDSLEQGWRIRAYPFIESGKEIQLNAQ
ncbi:FixH family protein [Bacterioplanoides sp. SCSIO 12839]|uniref:FixH family protein n=1 Tax=Bacterioplanoides sp. SCSIO 12839 TaxID=2829569 RepID=UPI002105F51A|nr:FixH family protein [Bacterioplanoides sp. SCSIO 12839]UTW49626.1 FixH family protein [Bacterioplanoides sp. SCSIO 12839]